MKPQILDYSREAGTLRMDLRLPRPGNGYVVGVRDDAATLLHPAAGQVLPLSGEVTITCALPADEPERVFVLISPRRMSEADWQWCVDEGKDQPDLSNGSKKGISGMGPAAAGEESEDSWLLIFWCP